MWNPKVFACSHSLSPRRYLLLSLAARSPWERAPSPALHPGAVPTAIWLWSIIWNSHAFEGDTAGAISQHSGGVLSGWGGGGRRTGVGGGGMRGDLAPRAAALIGSVWQIIDLSGKRWKRSHVCECSDCYWLTTQFGDLQTGRGGWQAEEGWRASEAFIPLSLPVCLSYLFLSLPGRAELLAGSQTERERRRVISFRMVGAFFCKHCLKLCRPLWRGRGWRRRWSREWGGGLQWLHSLTASLTKGCNVDGSFEAWMKCLCHVSDMFQDRKWKSFKFLCCFISECDSLCGYTRYKNHCCK